jgi:hypothetical protein
MRYQTRHIQSSISIRTHIRNRPDAADPRKSTRYALSTIAGAEAGAVLAPGSTLAVRTRCAGWSRQ